MGEGFARVKLQFWEVFLFFVNGEGVKCEVSAGKFEGCGGTGDDFAIEAGVSAGVAGACADLAHNEDERVLIAIGADFDNFLDVARSFAFVPDFGAGAGPINGLTEFEGEFKRFGVHVGEHERFSGVGIHGHGGDKAVAVEFRCEVRGFLDLFFIDAVGEGDSGHSFQGRCLIMKWG